jgi:hypothetical protein
MYFIFGLVLKNTWGGGGVIKYVWLGPQEIRGVCTEDVIWS